MYYSLLAGFSCLQLLDTLLISLLKHLTVSHNTYIYIYKCMYKG